MASRRTYGSYNDGCAAAHALDLIGERWTMIIVRELLLGPKRFTDIQRDVIGAGPAVLTQRLQELGARGIVRRRRLRSITHIDVYELTEWGQRLEAVNTALTLWALASPDLPRDADMSADTLILAMRAHARPVTPFAGRTVALSLVDSRRVDLQPSTYLARMSRRATTIDRTPELEDADAQVSATTRDWKACVIGGVPLERLPDVYVSGARRVVEQLVDATSLGDSPLGP